jgi:SAM-dependent methyltransferase
VGDSSAEPVWRSWIPGFDRWAATYDDEVGDPWMAYEAAWAFVERSLLAGLGGLAGRRVADIGCGTGEFLRRMVRAGAIGTGIEPSAGMRAAAVAKVPDVVIHDGDLAAIPLPDDSVDAVIATYVVSHLSTSEQPVAIEELLRIVAGAGPIVIVDVPSVEADDLPRVRQILRGAGRGDQIEWYERGFGLDLRTWERRLQAAGRGVVVEPLGPLLAGLAALPRGAA